MGKTVAFVSALIMTAAIVIASANAIAQAATPIGASATPAAAASPSLARPAVPATIVSPTPIGAKGTILPPVPARVAPPRAAVSARPTPPITPSAAVAHPAPSVTPTATAAPTATATATPAATATAKPTPAATATATPTATPTLTAVPAQRPTPATGSPAAAAAPALKPASRPLDGLRMYLDDPRSATSNPFNWSVTAWKSRHELDVYYRTHLYRTYHAVFGRSRWAGPKQWEGDRRTPEGDYLIISKHRTARFRWFLKLNYPNAIDRAEFEQMEAAGDVPRGMREGGNVGIHGTDEPILNLGNVDWTTGCISVDNDAISEIAALLPIGTLVVIKP
jgi:L,D-transpeptidase-like protein